MEEAAGARAREKALERTMEGKRPQVLLIGESPRGCSYLAKRLNERGCDCEFATCCREVESMLQARSFDAVVSPAAAGPR